MPLVDMIAPPLTTIRIRHHEMGLEAARLLLELMRKTSEGVTDVVLRPELIVRASTAAPRGSALRPPRRSDGLTDQRRPAVEDRQDDVFLRRTTG